MSAVIELADVEAAAERLRDVAVRTPVLRSDALDAATGASVALKAECLQRGGAFKLRGAYCKAASLPEAERARGLIAVSSGNHARAVAIAARLLGTTAVVLMPEDAPEAKVAGTLAAGAEIVRFDRFAVDREELLAREAAARGRAIVHPYDDPVVMAGQGTAALELVEDAGPLDVLLVPVGGGGLAAGCATVAAAQDPPVRVIGVEPELADDTRRSLEAGRRVQIETPATIADGLAVRIPGERTFAVVRERVEAVVTVTEAELRAAVRFGVDELRVTLEPSGACALAALLAGRVDGLRGGRVGAVLSGGNIGADRLVALLSGA